MPPEFVCKCGYRPRKSDASKVEVGIDSETGESTYVLHVICYDCGSEWVE